MKKMIWKIGIVCSVAVGAFLSDISASSADMPQGTKQDSTARQRMRFDTIIKPPAPNPIPVQPGPTGMTGTPGMPGPTGR